MAPLDRPGDEDLLTALGHPLRREVLRRMADGGAISPRKPAAALQHPLGNAGYHVRVLAGCAAVTLVETRPSRGSVEHLYRFAVEASWARHILRLGEIDCGSPGDSAGGAAT